MALGQELKEAREERSLTRSDVAKATRMKVQIVEALEEEDFDKIPAPIYARGFIKLFAEHVGLDPKPLIDEYSERTGGARPAIGGDHVEPEPEAEAEEESASDEPDLFSQAREPEPEPGPEPEDEEVPPPERAEEPAPTPPRADAPPSQSGKPKRIDFSVLEDVGSQLARFVRAVAAAFREAYLKILQDTRRAWDERRVGLSKIQLLESPMRALFLLIGVLIILIFVISGLSRCAGWPREDSKAAARHAAEPLRIVSDPPAPYLD